MNVRVGLEILLYVSDAVFNLVTVVDVYVPRMWAGSFVDLNDGAKEVLNTHTALEGCGNQRHAEECSQCVEIDMVASVLEFVVHVQCSDEPQVHVNKLCGEIKVAFQVG